MTDIIGRLLTGDLHASLGSWFWLTYAFAFAAGCGVSQVLDIGKNATLHRGRYLFWASMIWFALALILIFEMPPWPRIIADRHVEIAYFLIVHGWYLSCGFALGALGTMRSEDAFGRPDLAWASIVPGANLVLIFVPPMDPASIDAPRPRWLRLGPPRIFGIVIGSIILFLTSTLALGIATDVRAGATYIGSPAALDSAAQ